MLMHQSNAVFLADDLAHQRQFSDRGAAKQFALLTEYLGLQDQAADWSKLS